MKDIKVKEWFANKIQNEARKYHTWIDVKYLPDGQYDEFGLSVEVIDGYITLYGEVLNESEKALYVNLSTGLSDGSKKGWKTWIPKSVIGGKKDE